MSNVIYGLFDPNTNQLRYIGQTTNLPGRIAAHYSHLSNMKNTHKDNWLRTLIKNGQRAEVHVMEIYETSEELDQAEIEIISYYRYIGCDLTNSLPGGEGAPKGIIPWNKGLRGMGICKPTSGSFRKGRISPFLGTKGIAKSNNGSFKPGQHPSVSTEIRKGQHFSPATELKKGGKSPNQKLTDKQMEDIWTKWQNGQSQRSLAREYDIDRSSIKLVIARHLTGKVA